MFTTAGHVPLNKTSAPESRAALPRHSGHATALLLGIDARYTSGVVAGFLSGKLLSQNFARRLVYRAFDAAAGDAA